MASTTNTTTARHPGHRRRRRVAVQALRLQDHISSYDGPETVDVAEEDMTQHHFSEHSADWVAKEVNRVPKQAWFSRKVWLCRYCDRSEHPRNWSWYTSPNPWWSPWCYFREEYEEHFIRVHGVDWAETQAIFSYRKPATAPEPENLGRHTDSLPA